MTDHVQTAEPAAEQPTTAEQAANAKRRGQAIAGALAGVGVIAVLIATFVLVQVSDDDPATPSAAPPSAAAPSAAAPPENPAAALDPALQTAPTVKAGSGRVKKLQVTPLIKGTGPAVAAGQTIRANYVGVTYKDGKVFDSSWQSGQLLETQIGVGGLIPGFDQGLIGVPVGSRVQLDIPATMAYGEKAEGGRPAGDLRFVVDVLAAQ
ncbi:FKBP-type peptidyl-prolyl cis-trans isomerase [Jidongwangia harbinensis]|uniref:FKBP-type peptidyl-prolyl cis-trans isomerase n=1 Tax=Jidongwangia harbinensis TaxID=2878561 RepID=UPI001CDA36CA|nr:FKBP-type peptidyl-prolyl cis-trans isomerase [Jidongwangia harbinensis]MCA2216386.1 FKBP-type peptidyl-prolyl cis-trans isomerase [Jidongwangia harbinensis]